jgi:hypothetical protein
VLNGIAISWKNIFWDVGYCWKIFEIRHEWKPYHSDSACNAQTQQQWLIFWGQIPLRVASIWKRCHFFVHSTHIFPIVWSFAPEIQSWIKYLLQVDYIHFRRWALREWIILISKYYKRTNNKFVCCSDIRAAEEMWLKTWFTKLILS